ncbi:hypothetical protein [Bradyrhizobium sp.]|uniref:hypothetical protein n=1 Tax=Bradyrhizobium sp. TaxID=376 RepID=UPI003C270CFB
MTLVDQREQPITGTDPMTPKRAAFMGRSLLACAAVAAFKQLPQGGLVGDAALPALKWVVTSQKESKQPVIIFSIPGETDLTFVLTTQQERELGQALIAHADGLPAPAKPPEPSMH